MKEPERPGPQEEREEVEAAPSAGEEPGEPAGERPAEAPPLPPRVKEKDARLPAAETEQTLSKEAPAVAPSPLRRRVFEFTNTILFSVFLVGILALCYGALDRLHIRFDLTEQKLFTLSDQTRQTLKNLQDEVTVTGFFREDGLRKGKVRDLLDEYRALNSKVVVKFVDPLRDPVQTRNQGVRAEGSVVVEGPAGRKVIEPGDIFGMASPFGGDGEEAFRGEEAITAALISVTEREKKKICFSEGLGEKRLDEGGEEGLRSSKETLERENYEVEALNPGLQENLKGRCHVLAMIAPRAAFSPELSKGLAKHLSEGGRLFLALDFGPQGAEELLPNDFLSKYGISPRPEVVIDPPRSYFGQPFTFGPLYGAHPVVDKLSEARVDMLLHAAMPLEVSAPEGLTVTTLLRTSDSGYAKKIANLGDQIERRATDTSGELALGVAVENGEKKLRMVVVGDADAFSDAMVGQFLGNRNFFLNAINWLLEQESKISIRPKQAEMRRVEMTEGAARFMMITTIFVIPLLFLVAATGLWWKRRNL